MSENLAAWCLYVLSVFGCGIVWWRMVYALKLHRTAWMTTVILICILLAPSRVDPGMGFWAPSFMAALLELVATTSHSLQLHLLSMLVGFLNSVILWAQSLL